MTNFPAVWGHVRPVLASTELVTALVFSASLSCIKAAIILVSLNKDYMYLKCRFQWFPLETKTILQF